MYDSDFVSLKFKLSSSSKMPVIGSSVSIVSLIVSACAGPVLGFSETTKRDENPVIVDYVDENFLKPDPEYSVIGTVATHRTILIRMNMPDEILDEDDKRKIGDFCAEPPPDVALSYSSQSATGLGGNVGLTEPKSQISLDAAVQTALARSFSSAIAPLVNHSKGLSIYRSHAFVLCNSYMNGWMDKEAYSAKLDEALNKAVSLIEMEIANPPIPELPDVVVTPPDEASAALALEELKKVLAALEPEPES